MPSEIGNQEWAERQADRRQEAIRAVRSYLDRLEKTDRRAEVRIDAPDLLHGVEVTQMGDSIANLTITIPEGPPRV